MKYFLISSSKDPASRTMRDYLLEYESFNQSRLIPHYSVYPRNNDKELFEKDQDFKIMYKIIKSSKYENIDLIVFDGELVSLPDLDRLFSEKCLLIFLSKHASNSKIPTLTSHFTGNFSNNNSLGGKPFELGVTYPTFQKEYMKNLTDVKEDLHYYDLVIEATHHGPTSSSNPLIFVEIGSTEKEWENRSIASSVCKCILQTIVEIDTNLAKDKSKIAIGIGGNHYPQKFNQLILSSNVAFASIASKYNLKYINQEMIKQMKSRSIEQVTDIFFDKKSLGAEKNRLISIAESEDLVINFV
jgi:D-aminoacyl-tRNA deacylase